MTLIPKLEEISIVTFPINGHNITNLIDTHNTEHVDLSLVEEWVNAFPLTHVHVHFVGERIDLSFNATLTTLSFILFTKLGTDGCQKSFNLLLDWCYKQESINCWIHTSQHQIIW